MRSDQLPPLTTVTGRRKPDPPTLFSRTRGSGGNRPVAGLLVLDQDSPRDEWSEAFQSAAAGLVGRHGGTTIERNATHALVSFGCVDDAVRCAVALHRHVTTARFRQDGSRSTALRAAVHWGALPHESEDEFARPWTAAAVATQACPPGELRISPDALAQLSPDLRFACEPVETRSRRRASSAPAWCRIRWRDPRLRSQPTAGQMQVLEIMTAGSLFRYSTRPGSLAEATASHRSEREVNLGLVRETVSEMLSLLDDANRRGLSDQTHARMMRSAGRRLSDLLLTPEIRLSLQKATDPALLLRLDDGSLGIPWELLHDGEDYLGRRFLVGRTVSTRHPVAASPCPEQFSALIIADPQGNLPAASREGSIVKHALSNCPGVRPAIFAGHVTRRDVLENLRRYSVLHYCGHAESAPEVENGGLCLADGNLTPADLRNLGGDGRPLPALVFINACGSAQGASHSGDLVGRVHGIADAFLLAGVRHVIGTITEVPDEPAARFASAFYQALAEGAPLGMALRSARVQIEDPDPEASLFWAAYVLYGDPSRSLFDGIDEAFERLQRDETGPESACPAMRSSHRRWTGRKLGLWVVLTAFAVLLAGAAIAVVALDRKSDSDRLHQDISRFESRAFRNERNAAILQQIDAIRRTLDASGHEPRPASSTAVLGIALIPGMNGLESGSYAHLLARIEDHLFADPRLVLVDRKVLLYALTELQLSAANLTDPARSARVGDLTSARLLISLTLFEDQEGRLLYTKLVDSQTSEQLAIPAVPLAKSSRGEQDAAARAVARAIREAVDTHHPLRGVLVPRSPGQASINLGGDHGLRIGQTLRLSLANGDVVEARVAETHPHSATLTIPEGAHVRDRTTAQVQIP